MKKLYNAGTMFNEAQVNQRKIEGENLRKELPDFEILNPIDFDTNQGGTPMAVEIWNTDYHNVKISQYVIFELDSNDAGTILEFGLSAEQAKETQHDKFLVGVVSDFRYFQKSRTNQLNEFSINHFLWGALFDEQLNKENRIYLAKSHNDAIKMVKNHEMYLQTKDPIWITKNEELDQKHLYDDGSMYID